MAPWLPRMHVFEIHDQPWFHPWFRAKVQAALTETWLMSLRPLQPESPASIVARVLADDLGDKVGEFVFVDYCAGGGGPTPWIEKYINNERATTKPLLAGAAAAGSVQFVLTDLHPHIHNWALSAAASPNIHYAPNPVDASASPPNLLTTIEPPLPSPSSPLQPRQKTKSFRTFHLAFHHFPDPLARAILRDTLQTSSGLAIFELQDRTLRSFLSVLLLGLGVLAFAPVFAWRWRSPGTLFWSWVVPVLPFVLVWDGWMSSVRTRTLEEVEELMRSCGADGDGELGAWRVRSGRITHLPPWADLNWIIATKEGEGEVV
ncbi:hypothetical protein M406DRAFT_295243 [Cryphonectria parasitica EP155]|uniref:Uncharacterized protein n=1 Tax=Cryphonectria parasitica (strain ATCC 38755 / EP155) TaxID=660469 RepID=A0A9P4XUL3_CRYP1|nr:uncharacterized protein M406DRAFT_295243 [Cryphonectria parasitica EP155]KAF3761574.1 hypothetical protein M406DRAFT_295243 [Cryphonectria parasitica EP155]